MQRVWPQQSMLLVQRCAALRQHWRVPLRGAQSAVQHCDCSVQAVCSGMLHMGASTGPTSALGPASPPQRALPYISPSQSVACVQSHALSAQRNHAHDDLAQPA